MPRANFSRWQDDQMSHAPDAANSSGAAEDAGHLVRLVVATAAVLRMRPNRRSKPRPVMPPTQGPTPTSLPRLRQPVHRQGRTAVLHHPVSSVLPPSVVSTTQRTRLASMRCTPLRPLDRPPEAEVLPTASLQPNNAGSTAAQAVAYQSGRVVGVHLCA